MSLMDTLSMTDSKYNKMKHLIAAIEEYLQNKSEDIALVINRNLQSLSVAIDLSIFDPHTTIAAQFFASLYNLMTKTEQRPSFCWYCVDLLGNICRNDSARKALITSYQFIPCLARLLGDHLTLEKKIRLLRLMQDLSCGIKISWQIPHLKHLMVTLAKWIEGQDEDVVALSLGVMVNMCYRNLPAVYTLIRNIDVRRLIRHGSTLKGAVIEGHICKLLVILDYVNDKIPKEVLLKLINITFTSISEAFRAKDVISMRQILEFFQDIFKQNTLFNDGEIYEKHIVNLLQLIDNKNEMETNDTDKDPECMSIIFDFFHTLIKLKLQIISEFYPSLIGLSLKWIQTDIVSSQALKILTIIAINTDQTNGKLLEPIIEGLPIYLMIIDTVNTREIRTNIELNRKIGGLLHLLKTMLLLENTRNRLINELKVETISKIFAPILDETNSLNFIEINANSTDLINLYVFGIALICELVKYDGKWMNLQNSLLQEKQIHLILAQALLNNSKDIKCVILQLCQYFPNDLLAETMEHLQSVSGCATIERKMGQNLNEINFPVFSVAEVQRVDEVLNTLKSAISEKNLINVATSNVMELYEYKLVTMSHSERAAIASVEAASDRCTQLQHRIVQLTTELNAFHQLLYRSEKSCEQIIKQKQMLLDDVKNLTNTIEAEKGRNKVYKNQIKQKEDEFVEFNDRIEKLECSKQQIEEENVKMKQIIEKLEENSTKLEKAIQKRDEIIKKSNHKMENLNLELMEVKMNLKQKETELEKNIIELKDCTKELLAKKQIIDTITRLTHT